MHMLYYSTMTEVGGNRVSDNVDGRLMWPMCMWKAGLGSHFVGVGGVGVGRRQ